jgi:23S rRNA pseudouridine1911/1915/1917 synthase
VRLETGRTHQIRVHLAHVSLPLVGDPAYGGRQGRVAGDAAQLNALLHAFARQALHAQRLTLMHPGDGRELSFEARLPQDFEALLVALRADVGAASAARRSSAAGSGRARRRGKARSR